MWHLGRATCTEHLPQTSRKEKNLPLHNKTEKPRAYCPNIYTEQSTEKKKKLTNHWGCSVWWAYCSEWLVGRSKSTLKSLGGRGKVFKNFYLASTSYKAEYVKGGGWWSKPKSFQRRLWTPPSVVDGNPWERSSTAPGPLRPRRRSEPKM